jgi:hypothetical protein
LKSTDSQNYRRLGTPHRTLPHDKIELDSYLRLSKAQNSWALVAHACNSSYLGGRHQEDCGAETRQTVQETLSQKKKKKHKKGLVK